ncbi:E3 ubiquitin-protein ligase TRIM35-like isoform X2 [Syngnathus typhle]|uniref:E3 ubiquitin-protein ligase TRIM35-like isoform X2 n=1 Tax=Syngnathus typhle TaxID=161592 RepID=UPI002A699605|nr:E3 ubiquitin-protein ligase TRIM35-like isoform X2 [Syngnathus typhle]
MASHVEASLECPACLEIFRDPVMLPCTHSICKDCLQKWSEQKGGHSCPVCRTKVNSMDLPMNLSLRNVCEAFSLASIELKDICSLHKEKLKLFCLDHQELVCHICKDSEIHDGHKVRPIDEVAESNKVKLQEVLLDTKKRLKDYTEVEEEARLSAVREEERNKTQMIKEKIKALSTNMATLSDMIKTAEEQLMSDDLSLMKNFQTLMTRMQKPSDKPEQLPRGSLLDEAKHVGNLKFTAWEKMKEIVSYSPVILDPTTASLKLSLSEDLTSVSADAEQQRAQNPAMLWKYIVLGSALTSGMNIWDVEVGDNTDWRLGVVWEKSFVLYGFWITFRDDKYTLSSKQSETWYPSVKLKRIRFHVDTNEKSLSITESLTNTLLRKADISKWKLSSDDVNKVPYFFTRDKNPLKILPVPHCVTIQNQ